MKANSFDIDTCKEVTGDARTRKIEAYGLTALIAAGEVYELFRAHPPTP